MVQEDLGAQNNRGGGADLRTYALRLNKYFRLCLNNTDKLNKREFVQQSTIQEGGLG